MKTDFIQIASYASKAPSGHNTQPWKFHITNGTITVLPNLDVALPVVDGNNRELFISLGCAVENLCIAASYFGYTTHIIGCSIEAIILELTKKGLTIEDPLFHQIEKRQTNRNIYNGNKISDGILQQLQRFLLKVTDIGISYAFLNQPCEVTALAFDLREKLPVNKEHPTLIMRIGYAKQIPYSPRKKIETLLV